MKLLEILNKSSDWIFGAISSSNAITVRFWVPDFVPRKSLSVKSSFLSTLSVRSFPRSTAPGNDESGSSFCFGEIFSMLDGIPMIRKIQSFTYLVMRIFCDDQNWFNGM